MKKKFFIFVLLLLTTLAAATWYQWKGYQQFLKKPIAVELDWSLAKGTSAYKLGDELKQKNLIDNVYYYKLLLKLQPELRGIKAGEYSISPEMTIPEVLKLMVDGQVVAYQASIIEGSNIYELMKALNQNDQLVNKQLDLSVLKSNFPQQNSADNHVEGIFFADTYQFNKSDTSLDLLKRANNKLNKVLEEEWAKRAENLPYKSPYEALIMASIIEKETAVAAERPIISGVFVRRMHKGMKLQTDPTIIYGLLPNFDGNIRRNDIRNPHPWNTYVHFGLPPTPIAMVGREAIHAALHPADGNALYFVAKGDGSHKFSATLKEHNRAVRKYQLKR